VTRRKLIGIGNSFSVAAGAHQIASIGSHHPYSFETSFGHNIGPCTAFNYMPASGASSRAVNVDGAPNIGSRGMAVVGNVLEAYGTQSAPLMFILGDNTTSTAVNLIEAMNTIAGQRSNLAYNDAGTVAVAKDLVSKHSIHEAWNSKSDYFSTNGNLIGNWPLRHGVDGGYRLIIGGDSGADTTPDPTAWLGEGLGDGKTEMPVGDVVGASADFINDQSNSGGDAGGGDYSLGGSTNAPTIPAGETMFAVDLFGTAIPTDGSAFAGAVQ
jgi:hypothetical protein